ncbi:hypothetical protein ElyMa_001009000 [Elysia marginata]|uniref:Uncharacterized protein n=1 Tax=Elysia marginata TaxID=1093978 RepID=A0AAV4HK38_9GAST|nr:hypothetical protein ElyMa_001009000 [Elysia marginata]
MGLAMVKCSLGFQDGEHGLKITAVRLRKRLYKSTEEEQLKTKKRKKMTAAAKERQDRKRRLRRGGASLLSSTALGFSLPKLNGGSTAQHPQASQPLNYLNLPWTHFWWDHLVVKTNRYPVADGPHPKWSLVDVREMKTFMDWDCVPQKQNIAGMAGDMSPDEPDNVGHEVGEQVQRQEVVPGDGSRDQPYGVRGQALRQGRGRGRGAIRGDRSRTEPNTVKGQTRGRGGETISVDGDDPYSVREQRAIPETQRFQEPLAKKRNNRQPHDLLQLDNAKEWPEPSGYNGLSRRRYNGPNNMPNGGRKHDYQKRYPQNNDIPGRGYGYNNKNNSAFPDKSNSRNAKKGDQPQRGDTNLPCGENLSSSQTNAGSTPFRKITKAFRL